MYVVGSLLKQAIFENKELTKKLIKEITNEDISKMKESDLKFGYGYYKPVLFLECENDNNKNIYLTFQEIYEPVMMKGTIAEFLMKENKSKIFNKEIVICFNFDKSENNSVELIERKSYDRKVVFTTNIFNA
ncbi:hypothetical protein BX659_1611 [Orenia metallireducens]|uniref:Uncharacterized protein n=1 Tax=Orenia metallireducens TaxID=1413210 RepID=A0A285IIW1_9FIRM|nr:hypothetical protein [Orenia metallireducens]PRX16914.1 hypothetical protein BX659_1611 [Orenia metallireducens]SNY47894.1 hypothetical protein SAMN06265827_1611 [Orenia metallireducens]